MEGISWVPDTAMRSQVQEAEFFCKAFRGIANFNGTARVLDFGCGAGGLVRDFCSMGLDAYGCETLPRWDETDRLKKIEDPFRIPFPDNHFDFIVTTSVLEHAQNKRECFTEMRRVLKPGGYAMHLYPAKWYLPTEPHMFVPLSNFFYPYLPRAWFALWAILGVRNRWQAGHHWKRVVSDNIRFSQILLSYWTTRQYRRLSEEVFGNCSWPMDFYIEHAFGGYARLTRRLPLRRLWGAISREMRTAFMVQQRTSQGT
jgi:SAM-dependent methyltransferase